ncbi:MAG: hypothetical protein AAB600_04000 [Patescibacteria group bacterium]
MIKKCNISPNLQASSVSFLANWKFIGITVVLGLVVGGGLVWYANSVKQIEDRGSQTPSPKPQYEFSTQGIIQFTELEGGCWFILVDTKRGDAVKYEFTGIERSKLEQYRNKTVEIHGRLLTDMVSICQIGQIVEVHEMKLIKDTSIDTSISSTSLTAGWQTYRNEGPSLSGATEPQGEFRFEVRYPSGGKVTKTNYGPRIVLPYEEEGTNLRGKYLDIAINGSPYYTGFLGKTEQVSRGGNVFTKETRSGAAAGTANDTVHYIIDRDGKKYTLSFTLLIANLYNFDPSIRPKEFNKEKESAIFDQILSTFRFVK